MAVAHAASSLLDSRALDVDLTMLVEGEEEAGSAGFQDAVRKHKVRRRSLALSRAPLLNVDSFTLVHRTRSATSM